MINSGLKRLVIICVEKILIYKELFYDGEYSKEVLNHKTLME